MDEAKSSVNFFCVSEKGWNLQFTIRDDSEDVLLTRLSDLVSKLEKMHCHPKAVGRQPEIPLPIQEAIANVREATTQAVGPKPAAPNAPAPAQPGATSQPAGDLHFETARLIGSVNAGNAYWKIAGGKFSKHGVTIWPEVLATQFDLESLQPGMEYDIPGYIAHYSLNDKGQPGKIWKLEPVGERG